MLLNRIVYRVPLLYWCVGLRSLFLREIWLPWGSSRETGTLRAGSTRTLVPTTWSSRCSVSPTPWLGQSRSTSIPSLLVRFRMSRCLCAWNLLYIKWNLNFPNFNHPIIRLSKHFASPRINAYVHKQPWLSVSELLIIQMFFCLVPAISDSQVCAMYRFRIFCKFTQSRYAWKRNHV